MSEDAKQIGIHAYCAQQIRIIESLTYKGKTISETILIDGISYPQLVHPTLAYYYLPLLQLKGVLLRRIYRHSLSFKSFVSHILRKPPDAFEEPPDYVSKNKDLVFFLNFSKKHFSQVFSSVTQLLGFEKEFSTILVGLEDYESEPPTVNIFRYYSEEKTKNLLKHAPHPRMLEPFRKIALEVPSLDDMTIKIREDYFALMENSLVNELPWLTALIQAGDAMIRHQSPVLIVGGDFCDTRCIAMFLLAKKRKIPTLVIQQGLVTEAYSDFCFPVTDKIAIWGYETLEKLEKMNAPLLPFEITGNPNYDKYYYESNTTKSEQRIVLFISQPSHKIGIPKNVMIRMKRTVMGSLENIKGYQLVVKPHPDEKNSWFEKEIHSRGLKNVRILNPYDDTSKWISLSSVIIGFYSTALMEGIAAGKPIIVFDEKGDFNRFMSYVREGAAVGVVDAEGIQKFLLKFDTNINLQKSLDEGRKRFIERNLFKLDGKASERVLDIILKLTSTRS